MSIAAMDKPETAAAASAPVYRASSIKRRRRTKADLSELHRAMLSTIEAMAPMTLRQLFYALTVQGVVAKEEREYAAIGFQLLKLRRHGLVPWSAISDNTRWVRRPTTYRGPEHALAATARFYRRALWTDADARVEIWCEKDAIAGVIIDVTDELDVPFYVARGFASESYTFEAAEHIVSDGRPCFIYEFGDHDPSGVAASNVLRRKLVDFVGGRVDVEFVRAAVTPEQIDRWSLPSRPTKRIGNTHAARFDGDSVELDAVPPDHLRGLVRECIEQHIDPHKLAVTVAAEESERAHLVRLAEMFAEGQTP
jgi:hypothetical protein